MTTKADLGDQLHGVPIGASSLEVYCDCFHDVPNAVDMDRAVQYECYRVGDEMTIFDGLPIFGIWAPDLLRCRECERESLGEVTDGYGEALVELDIARAGGRYVLDTRELAVLDHSPIDDGVEPPGVPESLFERICQRRDWGALRRSRYTAMIDEARENGRHEFADNLERGLP